MSPTNIEAPPKKGSPAAHRSGGAQSSNGRRTNVALIVLTAVAARTRRIPNAGRGAGRVDGPRRMARVERASARVLAKGLAARFDDVDATMIEAQATADRTEVRLAD